MVKCASFQMTRTRTRVFCLDRALVAKTAMKKLCQLTRTRDIVSLREDAVIMLRELAH